MSDFGICFSWRSDLDSLWQTISGWYFEWRSLVSANRRHRSRIFPSWKYDRENANANGEMIMDIDDDDDHDDDDGDDEVDMDQDEDDGDGWWTHLQFYGTLLLNVAVSCSKSKGHSSSLVRKRKAKRWQRQAQNCTLLGNFKSESRTKIVQLTITHVCGTLRSFRNSFTIVTEDDRGFRFNQTFTIFRCIELFFGSIILD